MKPLNFTGKGRGVAVALLAVTAALLIGGCPVDTDQLIADVVAAALQSASDSFVQTLSEYLAQP